MLVGQIGNHKFEFTSALRNSLNLLQGDRHFLMNVAGQFGTNPLQKRRNIKFRKMY